MMFAHTYEDPTSLYISTTLFVESPTYNQLLEVDTAKLVTELTLDDFNV